MNPLTYPDQTQWCFTSRGRGVEKVGELALYWEIAGDPISDDYLPEETSAHELLDRWLEWVWDANAFDNDLDVPHVPISWSVIGESSGTFEAAPRVIPLDQSENFTTFYSHPVHIDTDERINWLRLPVIDKLWRPGTAAKGGFIQEATGFKPSAFQPTLDLRVLDAAGVEWSRSSR